jgi:hypothetical protein
MVDLSKNRTIGVGLPKNIPVENINNALREIDQRVESWHNRPSLRRRALREDYLEGCLDLVVVLRFFSDVGDITQFKDWRIVIWGGGKVFERLDHSEVVSLGSFVDSQEPRVIQFGPYRNDRIVFIGNIEGVDDPEGFVPAFVGIEALNEFSKFLTGTLYLSAEGIFKFLPCFSNWESGVRRRPVAFAENCANDEVFVNGPKIVDAISDQHAPSHGDLNVESFLAGLRVVLEDEKVAVDIAESLNGIIKVREVMFGPFDLCFNS